MPPQISTCTYIHCPYPTLFRSNRTEDDRGDYHFDQLDESVTQRFEGNAGLRIEVTEQNADGNGYDHLEIQGFVQWLTSRHGKPSSSVPCDNIHLSSTKPQLRTLLHWRDLFWRLHCGRPADAYRKAHAIFRKMPTTLEP